MKKKLLLIIALFIASFAMLNAQSIDFTRDGRHYYIASPNGRYFTGTVNEGPGCFFDSQTKEHFTTDIDSVLLFAVNNDGIACGSRLGQPGVWVRGGEWQMLTALASINGKPIESGEICGMSADATKFIALMRYDGGKAIPVYCEVDKYENWNNDDAWTFSTLPTPTKADLIYRQSAQFVQVCGMNYDGTRILGRYKLYDGKRDVPFIWQRSNDNNWTINFVAERCLFIDEVNQGLLELPDNREDMITSDEIVEYDIMREQYEKGIIYDLSPYSLFAWTGTGRYIPLSANVLKSDNSATYHAAVIDIDRDTLIVFTAVAEAGSVSVNDKGEVLIYSPQMTTFRTSYVASIDNPTEATPLLDYTKQRSNGAIDLAQYMTYQRDIDFDENPIYAVATGSAVWANEGNAFVTFNYDEWNETNIPHCYMVKFDAPVAVDNLKADQLAVYPNPTSGQLYFESQLNDVEVYDIAGRCVYSQSVAESILDLSALNPGTYVLTAISEGSRIVSKVMITR
ncbi:MAG: T9SS type A sorting domain-containing protein [Paludibacteraceae bacterium]|nr:T9SS type A sorting domain-containing protein [Paludibacteraceae bacterium]